MALLPQTILPITEPIGTVTESGMVQMTKNWWLLFYNMAQSLLGLTPPQVLLLESLEADVNNTDSAAISNALVALQETIAALGDHPPAPSFSDVTNALLLAQDGLLQDAVPQAQPASAISPTGSPFTYTAPFAGQVSITGGSVSQIQIGRQGTTVATGLTTGLIPVARLDQVVVTYGSAPTMVFLPN